MKKSGLYQWAGPPLPRYQVKLLFQILLKVGEILCFDSSPNTTLYIESKEAHGHMQGLDRTETKATVISSSTKVPDDTLHCDNLRAKR